MNFFIFSHGEIKNQFFTWQRQTRSKIYFLLDKRPI